MNKSLQEAILKQKARRAIKKAVKKKTISEETSLYATFVEPFADVVEAANLATQDILNSSLMFVNLLFFTWDPKKGAEKLKKHDERASKIAEKWKPLMEKTDAALATGDADILALTFAPGIYALDSVAGTAYTAAEGMGEFLSNTGIKESLLSVIPGIPFKIDYVDDGNEGKSTLEKIEMLFLGGVVAASAVDVVKSATSESFKSHKNNRFLFEAADAGDFIKDFNEFMEDTGVKDELKKTRDALIDNLKVTVEEFENEFDSREAPLTNLSNSETFEDFIKVLDDMKKSVKESVLLKSLSLLSEQEAPPSASFDAEKMKRELEDSAKKLAQEEDFKKKTQETASKEDITEEEYLKAAQKVIFLDAREGVNSKIEEGLKDLKRQIGEPVAELLPSNKALEVIKKTKEGIKFADFVETTKRKFNLS